MKKILFIFTLILAISCTTENQVIGSSEEIVPKDVEIILTTTRPEFDEVVLSYYDFDLNDWNYGPVQFEYDTEGNPLPITLTFLDYEYTEIEGNAYRNNDLPYSLKVEVYIDGELVLTDEESGIENTEDVDGVYASVTFDYSLY